MATFRNKKDLREFLEKKVIEYNHLSFIASDPVSVPHRFSRKQDIEIAGLFAAIFSWGNRTTIIQKSNALMEAMDESPYDFIRNHRPRDLASFREFKHRTFNGTDLLYFIRFLKYHYQRSDSLETAFISDAGTKNPSAESGQSKEDEFVKKSLVPFLHPLFFAGGRATTNT